MEVSFDEGDGRGQFDVPVAARGGDEAAVSVPVLIQGPEVGSDDRETDHRG